jgi:predicted RNA binding protein YcfA (HicA-like mRNA interferase family)/predicted RNase H-like HicB family nuclease
VKVRDVIKRLEDDGWIIVRQRGSHRQFRHAAKPGLVTVAGKPGDDLAPGTLNSVWKPSGVETVKYLIVIEQTATGYSAYSPDVPGCVATGATRDEVEREMTDAIAFHLEGLKEEGLRPPEPHTSSSYIEVPV